MRGLRGVPDRPHDGVPSTDGERVPPGIVFDEADQLPQRLGVESRELLAVGQRVLEGHGGFLLQQRPGAAGGAACIPRRTRTPELCNLTPSKWSNCLEPAANADFSYTIGTVSPAIGRT